MSETRAAEAAGTIGVEYISKADAERDAKALRDTWAAFGYVVKTEIVEFGFIGSARKTVFGFTSDMVNGSPKDAIWKNGRIVPKNR